MSAIENLWTTDQATCLYNFTDFNARFSLILDLITKYYFSREHFIMNALFLFFDLIIYQFCFNIGCTACHRHKFGLEIFAHLGKWDECICWRFHSGKVEISHSLICRFLESHFLNVIPQLFKLWDSKSWKIVWYLFHLDFNNAFFF